ncbi:MAG: beta-lactamase family protein, partial [Hyphomonas sp.]|nr:beta-lactamase family protein [Hyphomonas sp.]
MNRQLTRLMAALALLAGAACTAAPAIAPAETVAPVAEPDFSEAGLASLDAAMKRAVDDGQVKGVSTLLVKDGQTVNAYRYGIMRAADEAPIMEDTIFRIFSMSKPITGVALMTLYEDG